MINYFIRNYFAFSLLCVLSSIVFSQEKDKRIIEDYRKNQLKACDNFLAAIEALEDYLVKKRIDDFDIFNSKISTCDSILSIIENSLTNENYTENFEVLRKGVSGLDGCTLESLHDLANKGEKERFKLYDGRIAYLSKEGEIPFSIWLTIAKVKGDQVFKELTGFSRLKTTMQSSESDWKGQQYTDMYIAKLRSWKNLDDGTLLLKIKLMYGCPQCCLLVRILDENGNYLTHFTTKNIMTLWNLTSIEENNRMMSMVTRPTKDLELVFSVNKRDLRDASIIEVGVSSK